MPKPKRRRTPRITTQPRIPHWSYTYQDRGDYALIETISHRGAPLRTSRCILKEHVPQWMLEGMMLIDLAYEKGEYYAVVPGFGDWHKNKNLYLFYAQL